MPFSPCGLAGRLRNGCDACPSDTHAAPIATSVPPTAAPQPRTLTVFAAASLTGSFGEIGKNFEAAHPGVTVTFNFAGSQVLRTQIEQGASADVFASARPEENGYTRHGKSGRFRMPEKDFVTNC